MVVSTTSGSSITLNSPWVTEIFRGVSGVLL
jgi:hypothetical protein